MSQRFTGESAPVWAALAITLVVVGSVGVTAWLTVRGHAKAMREARAAQVENACRFIAEAASPLLASGDLTAVRRMVIDAARANDLDEMRIVLGDGSVLAAADPSKITAHQLPSQLPDVSLVSPAGADSRTVAIAQAVEVPGRGRARLEAAGPATMPTGAMRDAQAAAGIVGAVGLVALLLVSRALQRRLRGMAAIRASLVAFQRGERSPETLSVDDSLGGEARAWNDLLARRDADQRKERAEHAANALSAQRAPRGELDDACDALWQGLILIDENLRTKYANGAAAVFLRAKRDEIVGAEITRFVSDERIVNVIRGVASGAIRNRLAVEVERTGDSGSGVLRFSVRPVRREDSAAAMIVIEDVTQQRVADAARNAFVAQASHELRTPLTNIRLYVEQLLDGEPTPADRAQAINVINQESRRLERIVSDMLSVAEIEAGQLRLVEDDVRLDAVFAELEADYRAQAEEKTLDLRFDLPPKLPVIQGDRDKIALALHNLIGNALKYTPSGGSVRVIVAEDEENFTVDVVDTGIGISPEDAERVFDKFYRAKDRRVAELTGTGLGLALAREVIRLHGGDVTVQSELDKGSTFTLSIPVHARVA
ncbi:MAG TPA: ATP-binding protein [Phycisphaerales bacterium]|nr:ATP-binding protein [Phycisphaerales bacterium]